MRPGLVKILIEIVKTGRDCWDKSRFLDIGWDLLRNLDIIETFWARTCQKFWYFEISWSRNVQYLLTSQTRLRKSDEICYYINVSTDILISIEIFCSEKVIKSLSRFLNLDWDISIVETNFWKVSRFSQLSRLTFCKCRVRDSPPRHYWDKLRPPGLNYFKQTRKLENLIINYHLISPNIT